MNPASPITESKATKQNAVIRQVYMDSCPEVFSKRINSTKDILDEYIKRSLNDYELLSKYKYVCTDEIRIKTEFEHREEWELITKDKNVYLYRNLKWGQE